MNYSVLDTQGPLLPARDAGAGLVIAQTGQTLDGRIATVTGASKYINGRAALDHLHRLRACVDAVVVGVGTVAADDPSLTVRRCPGENPVRVVIDPRGRMPRDARLLRDGAGQVLVITGPGTEVPPGCAVLRLPAPEGRIAPRDIVAALAARGLPRLLLEGGAETLSRFLDAEAIDLLHILMAPMIIGSGMTGLRRSPVAELDQALRPHTSVHVFEDGDVLFTCDLRRSWERENG
ncbi:RibD family protein [Paroceanicella profunda]|uniref:RibD family protein n=1 Tax=Paroceanicella profunda TaxID=2579971 RepID=A0A5B8G1Q2_9RHOB|nr:RibD family protein [Paroceanicella profunda]QDL93032.1 RibD family protein [Paroceanicella profunda]